MGMIEKFDMVGGRREFGWEATKKREERREKERNF